MTTNGVGLGKVVSCRSCGAPSLAPIVSLGSTPIANALVEPTDAPPNDRRFPLSMVMCERCSLVQLGFALPADALFGSEFPYYSSVSDSFGRHVAAHVEQLVIERALGRASLAVEVGSNDGYLLRHFVAAGVPSLGVDPSSGPAQAAEEVGVETLVEFFGTAVARHVVDDYGRADVILANNVMAHVPDLNDVVEGLTILVADDGIITIENPYVRELVERVAFDTIYHEHYCYYSCSSIDILMAAHGLHLNDVEYFADVHGGTLRWTIAKRPARTPRCHRALERERAIGLTSLPYFHAFESAVTHCQESLRSLLNELKAKGHRVAAYGAAAKGATLMNSTGIGTDLVEYVVDRNAHKHGKLMPGCRLPIRSVDALADDRPDDLLLLAWNFTEEIIDQQGDYLAQGGRFIVPVPHVRYL